MSQKQGKPDWPIVAALMLAVVAVLAVYVGGYLAMGSVGTVSTQHETKMCRFYSAQWQADVFWPAAQVESFLARHDIKTGHMPRTEP